MINKYNLFKILCIGTVVSFFPIFILILIQQNLNIEINYQNVVFLSILDNFFNTTFLFFPLSLV